MINIYHLAIYHKNRARGYSIPFVNNSMESCIFHWPKC